MSVDAAVAVVEGEDDRAGRKGSLTAPERLHLVQGDGLVGVTRQPVHLAGEVGRADVEVRKQGPAWRGCDHVVHQDGNRTLLTAELRRACRRAELRRVGGGSFQQGSRRGRMAVAKGRAGGNLCDSGRYQADKAGDRGVADAASPAVTAAAVAEAFVRIDGIEGHARRRCSVLGALCSIGAEPHIFRFTLRSLGREVL